MHRGARGRGRTDVGLAATPRGHDQEFGRCRPGSVEQRPHRVTLGEVLVGGGQRSGAQRPLTEVVECFGQDLERAAGTTSDAFVGHRPDGFVIAQRERGPASQRQPPGKLARLGVASDRGEGSLERRNCVVVALGVQLGERIEEEVDRRRLGVAGQSERLRGPRDLFQRRRTRSAEVHGHRYRVEQRLARAVDVERAEGHRGVEQHPNDFLGAAERVVAVQIDEGDHRFEPARLREHDVAEVGERVLEIGARAVSSRR